MISDKLNLNIVSDALFMTDLVKLLISITMPCLFEVLLIQRGNTCCFECLVTGSQALKMC